MLAHSAVGVVEAARAMGAQGVLCGIEGSFSNHDEVRVVKEGEEIRR
jgi:hypothetical protein